MLSTVSTISAFLGSLAISVCYLPLIYRLHKIKEADSQSIAFWVILLIALSSLSVNLFTVYLEHGEYRALIVELINVALATVVLGQVIFYKRKGRSKYKKDS